MTKQIIVLILSISLLAFELTAQEFKYVHKKESFLTTQSISVPCASAQTTFACFNTGTKVEVETSSWPAIPSTHKSISTQNLIIVETIESNVLQNADARPTKKAQEASSLLDKRVTEMESIWKSMDN